MSQRERDKDLLFILFLCSYSFLFINFPQSPGPRRHRLSSTMQDLLPSTTDMGNMWNQQRRPFFQEDGTRRRKVKNQIFKDLYGYYTVYASLWKRKRRIRFQSVDISTATNMCRSLFSSFISQYTNHIGLSGTSEWRASLETTGEK